MATRDPARYPGQFLAAWQGAVRLGKPWRGGAMQQRFSVCGNTWQFSENGNTRHDQR